MKKIDWLIIFFFIITSVFTLKDLFKAGFYTSHDGTHQIVRLYYFDQVLKDGQIPPRWAGGLLNGFGYPLFSFSYHMPWFIAEPLHLAGLSIIDSIKMTFLIGFIISGITMYFFQRELFGRFAAFVGSVIYLYAPYRFSNIFVRAAIGDATAFIFPPLLFLALYKLKKDKVDSRWITIGAISIAGLLLSHAMVFFFFFLSFGLYTLYSLLFFPKKIQFIKRVLMINILAFGLSAYYFFPSIFERNITKFSELMNIFIGNTFLTFNQLIYSTWGYGMMNAAEGGMSFQLGIVQWTVIILTVIFFINIFVRKSRNKQIDGLAKESIFYLLLFFATIYVMLPVSLPFWNMIKNIVIVDFTWRILPLSVFAAAVLAGFLIREARFKIVFALVLLSLAFYGNRNHIRINQSLDWTIPFYLKLEKTTNSYGEYTPKWVQNNLVEKEKPKVEFTTSDAEISIKSNKSNQLDFSINTKTDGTVRINTIYYPGWQVWVNKTPQKINYESSGFMEFPITKGKSEVSSRFSETPFRLICDLISLASFVLSILILIKPRKI